MPMRILIITVCSAVFIAAATLSSWPAATGAADGDAGADGMNTLWIVAANEDGILCAKLRRSAGTADSTAGNVGDNARQGFIPPPSVPATGYAFIAPEDRPVGSIVGSLPTQGSSSEALRYSLQSVGAAAQRLTVDGSGTVRVGSDGLDYEAEDSHSHSISGTVSSPGGTVPVVVSVNLLNVNEPPIVPAGGITRTLPIALPIHSDGGVRFRDCIDDRGRNRPIYPANPDAQRGFKVSRVMLRLFQHVADPEGSTVSYVITAGNPTHTTSGKTRQGFCVDEQGYLRALYATLINHDESYWDSLSVGHLDTLLGGHTMFRSQPITLQVKVSDPQGLSSTMAIRYEPNPEAMATYARCEAMPPNTREWWRCRYHPENLQWPVPVTTTDDRATLPDGLAQPKSNYRLVMRDEFDGVVNEFGERTLDHSLWYYPWQLDQYPEARDGKFSILFRPYFSRDNHCGYRMNGVRYTPKNIANSYIRFKYGYMEFFVSSPIPIPRSFNTIISYASGGPAYSFPSYVLSHPLPPGESRTSLEDVLSLYGTEIDIMENYTYGSPPWVTSPPYFVSHYTPHNSGGRREPPDTFACSYRGRDCTGEYNLGRSWRHWESNRYKAGAGQGNPMKLGLEWTPEGYAFFFDNDQARADKPPLRVTYNNNNCGTGASGRNVGRQRCTYNHVYGWRSYYKSGQLMGPGDKITRGVTHIPQNFIVEAGSGDGKDPGCLREVAAAGGPCPVDPNDTKHPVFSGCNPDDISTCCYVGARFEIDYFRIWKPYDNYAGMTPVYE